MNPSSACIIHERLQARLRRLYGDNTERIAERLAMLVGRYGLLPASRTPAPRWDARDTILIAYGDMIRAPGEKPLATLTAFANRHLQEAIRTIHLLPFFPYSSDDGFSVIHFRNVDPNLGDWPEIRTLNEHFRLMFDLVLNHVSSQSGWFQDYQAGVAPGRHYFIEADPAADHAAVVRPRSLPLLTAVTTPAGKRWVWTTFSNDQIDLDYSNPDVLFELLDILLFYVSMGARILRLDAIAFLWKKNGTPCIHLPETHEIVKLFRDLLDLVAPDVLLLTETNVPQPENLSYFGAGDEAHMVYQFSLPPLLLHALQTGTSRHLRAWAAALPPPPPGCTYLNFTASHDGIGVRPLQDLLPTAEIQALVERTRNRGGQVSTRRNRDGTDSPYELNITYFDALRGNRADDPFHLPRFLCSQTVMLALRGIPAVYFHSLTATPNDLDGVRRTGRARSINRRKWDRDDLQSALDDPSTPTACIFREYTRLLRLRADQPAFHPDGAQRVLDFGDRVFAVERTAPDQSQTLLAISNFTDQPVTIPLDHPGWPAGMQTHRDLLRNAPPDIAGNDLRLAPYQTLWLA